MRLGLAFALSLDVSPETWRSQSLETREQAISTLPRRCPVRMEQERETQVAQTDHKLVPSFGPMDKYFI